jgi:hypothetical protein
MNQHHFYRKLCASIIGVMLCALPQEGHVSQVHRMDGPGLASVIGYTQHAVIARDLKKTELFKQVVFPKSTSFQGRESEYTELVALYQVTDVLQSDTIRKGEIIRVWHAPAIGETLMKEYHETGATESPVVMRYTPQNPPKPDAPEILLLGDTVAGPTTAYTFIGSEDTASKAEIMNALRHPDTSLPAQPAHQ